ncbi:MAG: excinuclease ABC subunit UvrA [Bacteroidetes bacterium]|nr:excinuclease ABC subunit UvrA [Bacteroidota bacterium]
MPDFPEDTGTIEVIGAREHNLKALDLSIPRNRLIVFTGVSGSGKSSLAFDTIFAEGQRRYLDSFSAYARQFIGDMKRPDVDKIQGLSPVISIEQKTVSRNPRSTVGTITEVYDFLRLLFARAGEAYSYESGERMVRFTEAQIIEAIEQRYFGKKIAVLAPLVKGRKGHYRELFELYHKRGFQRMRVDGVMLEIKPGMQLDRYKIHDIELVIDRLDAGATAAARTAESVRTALKMGKGTMMVLDMADQSRQLFSKFLMDPVSGLSYDEPNPNSFSFNSPYGACPTCEGLGEISEVSAALVIPDPSKSINRGGLAPLGEVKENWTFTQLRAMARHYKFSLADPIGELSNEVQHMILHGSEGTFPIEQINESGRKTKVQSSFKGVFHFVQEQFFESDDDEMRSWAEQFMHNTLCPDCEGSRLKKEARYYRIAGKNIADLAAMNIGTLLQWLEQVQGELNERQKIIATDLLKEIHARVSFLQGVGLSYLNLNSPARTLSGGEAQRIRLATQIGSRLTNVLYILDEPSIGLHQRDNEKLISSLKELRDLGNTVLVVEHDRDMMLESDHLVEIGPGAGVHGGRIVAQGDLKTFSSFQTTTARFLAGKLEISVPEKRRKPGKEYIELSGCNGNNLNNVQVRFPLGCFICVTGVSGSGKSTLINETLFPLLSNHIYGTHYKSLAVKSFKNLDLVDKVIRIDQSPIGRTPRSNPATYVGVFTEIRNLFANLPEAKIRGYKPGRFSFNVKGGRCETCGGAGRKVIEMNFLPNVEVPCDTCHGRRYNRETLEVRYKGKSITDVLEMSVEQAVAFFEHIPLINRKIITMQQVGLGYITLGQSSTTLSGGEAQRVKLATELSKRDTGKTFYILDEPTTGLHFDDIRQLLEVLQELVNRGNTVLVVEHNLDVIKVADHVIDLGPEGGSGGGHILISGTPEQVAAFKNSHTGRFLKKELKTPKAKS